MRKVASVETPIEEDREFLAWLAGFWEGEGSLDIKKRWSNSLYYLYNITISQSDRLPLDLIQNNFAGMGKIEEQRRRNPKHKTGYKWVVWRKLDVLKVLKLILPFLKFKQKKVKEAINFLEGGLHFKCSLCGGEFLKMSPTHKYCGDCHKKFKRSYQREYAHRRRENPEFKERERKYHQEYRKRPEVIEHKRRWWAEYQKRPDYRERRRVYDREYYQKNKNRLNYLARLRRASPASSVNKI